MDCCSHNHIISHFFLRNADFSGVHTMAGLKPKNIYLEINRMCNTGHITLWHQFEHYWKVINFSPCHVPFKYPVAGTVIYVYWVCHKYGIFIVCAFFWKCKQSPIIFVFFLIFTHNIYLQRKQSNSIYSWTYIEYRSLWVF